MSTIDEKVGAASAAGVASKDAEAEAKDAGATTTAEAVAPSPEEVSQATEAAPAPADEIVDGEFEMLDAGAQEAEAGTPTTAEAAQETNVTVLENVEYEMLEKPFAAVTGDAEDDNTVWDVCVVLMNHQNDGLKASWHTGDRFLAYIEKHKPKSISAALEEFAKYVREASYGQLSELSSATLRKALKFRQKFSKERLELAVRIGMSYRNALSLCTNDVTNDNRDLILQEVSNGSLKQTMIKAKVKELHPPEKKEEKRGGSRTKKESPLEFMTRIQKDMDKLLSDMKENYRKHAADALDSEDEETKVQYTQHYEVNAEQIELLNEEWAKNTKMTRLYFED
ncbi:hypothetical protein P4B35_11770 [Pontiellaceae bacterium B12227]|nr:hypothetical protein [Pontiellaceae bacterium B12227]